MNSVVERLYEFFFAPRDSRVIYLMRIAFGLIGLYYYLRTAVHFTALYSPQGINGYEQAARWPGFPALYDSSIAHLSVLRSIPYEGVTQGLFALLTLAALCFAIGLFSRTSGLVLALLHVQFSGHQPNLTSGWVEMYHIFVLTIVASQPHKALSVDAWLAKKRHKALGSAVSTPAWGMRLLQIHVILMYVVAGFPRLVEPGWYRGEMVFNAAVDVRYARFLLDWYALKPVLTAATYYAWVLEPVAPVLLLFERTKGYCVLALIALHMGIELIADVGMWQFTMSAAVLCFLPQAWVRRLPGMNQWPPTAEEPHAVEVQSALRRA